MGRTQMAHLLWLIRTRFSAPMKLFSDSSRKQTLNIVASPQCNCGSASEDIQHYLFACLRYNDQRNNLTASVNFLPNLTY